MSAQLHRVYRLLPAWARSTAATAHGIRLRRWRYGSETDLLVEQALEREQWSVRQWSRWREERLAFVLHRAATRVPFYREAWARRRRHGDRSSWELLENWPILQKEQVRLQAFAFVADDCDRSRMYHEHTSGTTGKPLDLWWSRETVRRWYALFEARWRHWYGVSRHDRWANIGGQLVVPVEQSRPPFWVWNAAMRQLYMSSYHLAPHLVPHYLDALERYGISYVWGYTSSLHALARGGMTAKRVPGLTVAISNAEPVLLHQRREIEAGLRCPVRETYGMAEVVTAASECGEGSLHSWPEVGWIEVLENRVGVPPGETGDLVCTGLLNSDMPLVRYALGDRGAVSARDEPCACGRTLPRLNHVEGRADDVLYTRDGRRVGRLDPVFKTAMPIHEAQLIQEHLDAVRLRYVPAPGFDAQVRKTLTARIRERMGPVAVVFEEVDRIPRAPNGKFRAVICDVDPAELLHLGQ